MLKKQEVVPELLLIWKKSWNKSPIESALKGREMSENIVGFNNEKLMEQMLFLASELIYEEPSELQLRAFIKDEIFQEELTTEGNKELVSGMKLLDSWCQSHQSKQLDETTRSLQREWLRLFVGVGMPDVPSWSNFYCDTEHRVLGSETVEVRRTYRRFGLQVENLNKEPDDSLGLMLRFLAYLRMNERREVAQGDEEEAIRLRLEQVDFLKEHILPWIALWRYKGEKYASSDYFKGVVLYVFGVVRYYSFTLGFLYDPTKSSFVLKKDSIAC